MEIVRITTVRWFLAACLSILAGCASLDGRGLVAGKSTGAEVQAAMGAPAARIARPDGDEILYFPKDRVCYAVTIGRDSVMKGIEQRLNRANFAKVVAGKSTGAQVRELLGPPSRILPLRFKGTDVWEYPWFEVDDKRILIVEIAANGLVLRAIEEHDQDSDKPSLD
jgi:hypothetical protein